MGHADRQVTGIVEDPLKVRALPDLQDFDTIKARFEDAAKERTLLVPHRYPFRSAGQLSIARWKRDDPSGRWTLRAQDNRVYIALMGLVLIGIGAACFYAELVFGSFDPFSGPAISGYIATLAGAAIIAMMLLGALLLPKRTVAVKDNGDLIITRTFRGSPPQELAVAAEDVDLLIAKAAARGLTFGIADQRYILLLLVDAQVLEVLGSHWSLARILRSRDELPDPLRSRTVYALEDFELDLRPITGRG